MKVAVVGAGYWGKNLIRTFNNLGMLSAIYDLNEELLESYKIDSVYNEVEFGKDYTYCLKRWDIDGIVIATPPGTHYSIAKTALMHDKHVFVEKPMTLNEGHAIELVDLAKERDTLKDELLKDYAWMLDENLDVYIRHLREKSQQEKSQSKLKVFS